LLHCIVFGYCSTSEVMT